jgi:signal transduction histidine kinase
MPVALAQEIPMRLPGFFQSTRFLLGALVGFSVFAIVVVTLVSTMAVHFISREEDKEVLEGYALIEGAYQLQIAADQEVILIRDHLLTGRSGINATEQAVFNEFESALAGLKRLTTDAVSLRLLEEIGAIGREYRRYSEQVIGLIRENRRAEALALFNAEGPRRRLAWNRKLEELIAREHVYVAGRHDEVNRIENWLKTFLLWAAALSIPATLLLAWVVGQRVITPLGRLEAASRAIGDGDFVHRLAADRPDEFGRVAQAFNTMVERVSEGVSRLRSANENLQRADRVKDEFLSIVSHELRTPLNFIQGFTSLLANEFAGPLTPQQRDYLDNIGQSSERMLLLVNDLLDVAALQAGKLPLEPEPCVYGPLVEEAVQNAMALAEARRLTLSTALSAPATLTIDPRRVGQVLANLIANAIKFTPEGGAVTVRVSRDGDDVRTEVSDTGIGIPPEDRHRLFLPFSQLDMTATRKAGGTGLGLSISKALVEAHGGQIGVESRPGQGSTFWFTLPHQSAQNQDPTSV